MSRKKCFSEKRIMSIIMVIVTVVLLVAATVAWFTRNDQVGLKDFGLKTDEPDIFYVDVRIEPYSVDLSQETVCYSDILTNEQLRSSAYASPEQNGNYQITRMSLNLAEKTEGVVIDLGQPTQNSIEVGKLGPGSYGQTTFWIMSKNGMNNGYRLLVEPKLSYTSNRAFAESEKKELEALVADHIRFYGKREGSSGDYRYLSPVEYGASADAGRKDTLIAGQEKEVTLYWNWFYEYTDIPVQDGAVPSTTSSDIESYDLGDTKIGNYVTQISFDFTVTGEEYGNETAGSN